MVTTRSADKQANTNTKTENLTLRSKPEEESSKILPAQVESDAESVLRTKAKVLINVPPPRKRTRLSTGSNNGLETDVVPSASSLAVTRSQLLGDDSNSVKEIPDSQESSVQSKKSEQMQAQSDFVAFEEESTPSQKTGTKRKRKVVSAPQTLRITETTTKVISPAASQHRRFGSEEPPEDEIKDDVALQGKSSTELNADDESDAPEMTTSKSVPLSSSQPRTTRQSRKKRNMQETSQAKPALEGLPPNAAVADQSISTGHEISEHVTTPALKASTSQGSNTSATLQSEDSNDLAFVTARTNRHIDFFATPLSGTPTATPNTKETSPADDELGTTPRRSALAIQSLSANTQDLRISKPRSKSNLTGPSSTILPPKANSSLESYRRQLLQDRAERSSGSRRGGNFKLQTEWSGKRRRFLVGY